jgi:hypothetical protein
MTKEEKLCKAAKDFSTLPDEKQDYVLGILQALVFADSEGRGKTEKANCGVEKHTG